MGGTPLLSARSAPSRWPMAEKRFARVDVTKALGGLEGVSKAARIANQELQIELAEAGRDKMKDLILERGTGSRRWGYNEKTASGSRNGPFKATPLPAKVKPRSGNLKSSGGPSRFNTGRMMNAVRVRFERGGSRALSAFGWINAPAKDEAYFEAQEYGFEAGGFRPDQKVDGMFALRDARLHVTQEVLPKLVRKYKNRIARGVA